MITVDTGFFKHKLVNLCMIPRISALLSTQRLLKNPRALLIRLRTAYLDFQPVP